MSKQSKLEAKQRVIALEYALKTPLSAFGVNSAEQVVDAANTYLKFLQGGTVEVSGFGDIWPKLHEDAARIPEIIDAEKARIEQAHIKAANLNDSGIRADRIAEGQAKTARRANEFIEVEKPSKEKCAEEGWEYTSVAECVSRADGDVEHHIKASCLTASGDSAARSGD